MNKIFKILKREYLIVVKTKTFIIGTILTPIVMIAFILLPALTSRVQTESQATISVIDETGIMYDDIASNLDDKLSDGREKYLLNNIRIGHRKLEDIEKELQTDIKIRKISGYIHIPEDVSENMRANYYARNVTNFQAIRRVRSAVNRAVMKHKIIAQGLEPSVVMKLTRNIKLNAVRVTDGKKKGNFQQTYYIGIVMMFVLYMTILMYGTFVMRSVVEEKSSRIVEILISNGADINARDNNGKTALSYAVENGYTEIAELLIAKGADVNARDGNGRTPLWYAQEKSYNKIAELLRKHVAK